MFGFRFIEGLEGLWFRALRGEACRRAGVKVEG